MSLPYKKKGLSPELSEALRTEIRTVLEAGGRPFDINIARRVYDLAIAASDMCVAATDIETAESGVRRYLTKYDQERNTVSPELSEALRNEIRTALEAGGGAFDINVARRVYDLAIAARDMCVAASGTVKEAIDQIKDTNGPMETLDAADTPESQVQVSESFGARLLRELMATLPMLQGSRGEDPKRLVHALAEARRNGMHDVAEQLEVKLFGRPMSGSRPVIAEKIEVDEGSYGQGFADGWAGAFPVSQEGAYHEGYLKGTEAKFLEGTGDHSAAIAWDVQRGLTSQAIRDEIIGKVGMMAYSRTPEMQARYAAAIERERSNGATGVVIEPGRPVGIVARHCDHPTEALYDAPYDDGYQVFCRVCGKHVRLGRFYPGFEHQRARKIADVRAYAPTPDAPCSLCGHPAGSMHKAGCGSNTTDDELDRLALIARGWKAPSETWVCGHGKRHPNPAPGFSMSCNCSVTVNGATP